MIDTNHLSTDELSILVKKSTIDSKLISIELAYLIISNRSVVVRSKSRKDVDSEHTNEKKRKITNKTTTKAVLSELFRQVDSSNRYKNEYN